MLASGSCASSSSGAVKDFGVDGSEDIMLPVQVFMCFDEGSKSLISGLVINPNTCIASKY